MAKAKAKESTSTELVTVSPDKLAWFEAQLQAKKTTKANLFPRLGINKTAEDAEGNVIVDSKGVPLGSGTYAIDSLKLYQKEIKFQPFFVKYNFQKYTEDFKIASRTIFFDDWGTQPIDSTGGIRCGRPDKKGMANYSEQDQEKYKKEVPCFMHVFGFAFFDGGNQHGELVDFRVAGGKFFAVSEGLKLAQDNPYALFDLSLVRDGKGKNIFYSINMTLSADKADSSDYFIDSYRKSQDWVDAENEAVVAAHHKANQDKLRNTNAKNLMDNIVETTFEEVEEDDNAWALNDDLPEDFN